MVRVEATPPLPRRIMDALLLDTQFDFKTVESLADELGVPEELMRVELRLMEKAGMVRRPVIKDPSYDDWYRAVSRGLTKREKRARWKAIFTFQTMRDVF